MIKKMTSHGDNLVLMIERDLLDRLNIDADTPLDVSTDGEVLVVSPVRDRKRRKDFEAALKKVNEKYGRALKRLAD